MVPEERRRENYHQKRVDDAADLLKARARLAQTPQSDGIFSPRGMVLFNGLNIEKRSSEDDNTLASNDLPVPNSFTAIARSGAVSSPHQTVDLTSNETAVFVPVSSPRPPPGVSPTWSPDTTESPPPTFPALGISPSWSAGNSASAFTVTSASEFAAAASAAVGGVNASSSVFSSGDGSASFKAPSVAHTTAGRGGGTRQSSYFGGRGGREASKVGGGRQASQVAIEASPYATCIGQRRGTVLKSYHGSEHSHSKGGGLIKAGRNGSRVFSHTAGGGSNDSNDEEIIKEIIPMSNSVSRKTAGHSSNDTTAPPRRGGGGRGRATANNTYVVSTRSSVDSKPEEIMNLFPVLDAAGGGDATTTSIQMEPRGGGRTNGDGSSAETNYNNNNTTETAQEAAPLTADEAQDARKRCTNCNSTVAQRLEDLLQFEAAVLTIAKMLVEAVYWYESAMKDATRNADAEAR